MGILDVFKKLNPNDVAMLREKLATLKNERDQVTAAPMARVDYETLLLKGIDSEADLYRAALFKRHNYMLTSPMKKEYDVGRRHLYGGGLSHVGIAFQESGNPLGVGLGLQSFLCFAFCDQVKAAIKSALDGRDWSAAGLPLAERKTRIAQLDKEIAAADRELKELKDHLDRVAVGLRNL